VTSYDFALLLHLVAAIAFFAGITVAAVAHFSARRLERPGEIAAVLSLARTGVLLVGAGALLVLVSGLWLIEETGRSLGDGWIALSLLLLALAGLLGAIGGRKPKRARLLAEGQAADARPDPAIVALLRDPVSLTANVLAAACAVAILVLMVWRPD
jgi:uncharacterized membrane protein